MRTTRESITFDHPFSLTAVDKLQPAGTYAVGKRANLRTFSLLMQ